MQYVPFTDRKRLDDGRQSSVESHGRSSFECRNSRWTPVPVERSPSARSGCGHSWTGAPQVADVTGADGFDSHSDDYISEEVCCDDESEDTSELLNEVSTLAADVDIPPMLPVMSPRLKFCSDVYADLVRGADLVAGQADENDQVAQLRAENAELKEALNEVTSVLSYILKTHQMTLRGVFEAMEQDI